MDSRFERTELVGFSMWNITNGSVEKSNGNDLTRVLARFDYTEQASELIMTIIWPVSELVKFRSNGTVSRYFKQRYSNILAAKTA